MATAHSNELNAVRSDLNEKLEAAKHKAKQVAQVAGTVGEIKQKLAEELRLRELEAVSRQRAEQELARLMENSRQDRARWESERDRIRQEAAEAKDRAVGEAVAAVQSMADVALKNQKDEAATKLNDAINQMRQQAAQEQEEAVRALQEESEKIIGSVEEAMENLRAEKDNLVQDLGETKAQLEEVEDTLFDCQSDLQTSMKLDALHSLKLTVRLKSLEEKSKAEMEQSTAEWTERHEKALKIHEAQCEKYEDDIRKLSDIAKGAEEREQEIKDTLMNHKRETLMQHKIKSTVIQNDLALLSEQREELDGIRAGLLEEMNIMEKGVDELEIEIREHTKNSAIKDGRVNVAFAKKKRRLDGELERLLEGIEEKRTRLQGVESKLNELNEQKQDKEDEMKDVERDLVEVLVEQQKKVLNTLNSASVSAKVGLMAVKFKNKAAKNTTENQASSS